MHLLVFSYSAKVHLMQKYEHQEQALVCTGLYTIVTLN